jgi:uncharacterized RDD family membrane protein YckC
MDTVLLIWVAVALFFVLWAGAYLMDTVLLIWVAVVLFFVLWASGVSPGVAAIAAWAGTEGGIRGLVYAPLLMRRPGAHNGQTLGKQLTGIRVVREDGRPMTYGAAVLREWVAAARVGGQDVADRDPGRSRERRNRCAARLRATALG